MKPDIGIVPPTPEPDILLDPIEAAARLGVTVQWLYRNAHKFTFTRKLSRKCLRFSEKGLADYIERGRL